jgi:hypothetical protein
MFQLLLEIATRRINSPRRSDLPFQLRARNLIVLDEGDVDLNSVDISECSIRWDVRRLHHDLSSHANWGILRGGQGGVEKIELIIAR